MRSLFVVVAGLALASAIVLPNVDPLDITFVQFQEFTHQFNKTYDSPAEYENRFMIFSANMARVMELRSEHKRATGENADHIFGVTKFADLTAEEFAMYKGFTPRPRSNRAIVAEPTVVAPSSIDWRTKGVVTPVKNQDQCGSCWAFSATEEIESRWAMQGNKLTKLSVQQIVSCDTVDQGCNGGDTPTAYQYVQQAGGLELDSVYPYTSGGGDSGTCKDHKQLEKVNVKNYSYATPPCTGACDNQSEPTMEANLATYGPLSICVNANDAWQMYTSGILSSGCSHAYSDLDHCVQVVGYNKAHSTPYWIVRNSWDVTWGVEGYIYIAMGHNLCGVADEATFVHTIKA